MAWLGRMLYRLVRAEVQADIARAVGASEALSRAYTNAAVSVGFQKSTDMVLEGATLSAKRMDDLAGTVLEIGTALQRRVCALEGSPVETPAPDAKRTIN